MSCPIEDEEYVFFSPFGFMKTGLTNFLLNPIQRLNYSSLLRNIFMFIEGNKNSVIT